MKERYSVIKGETLWHIHDHQTGQLLEVEAKEKEDAQFLADQLNQEQNK